MLKRKLNISKYKLDLLETVINELGLCNLLEICNLIIEKVDTPPPPPSPPPKRIIKEDINFGFSKTSDDVSDYELSMIIDFIESEVADGKPLKCVSCRRIKCDLSCDSLINYQIYIKSKKWEM